MIDEKYQELWETSMMLEKYYDIDKIKPWVIYVYDKDDTKNADEGLFDIYKNKIIFYTKNHTIIKEAKPIIKKIQELLEDK